MRSRARPSRRTSLQCQRTCSLAEQAIECRAATAGTMPTHGLLFIGLLVGTVLLVGLLNYVPALALGPVIEHLVLWK